MESSYQIRVSIPFYGIFCFYSVKQFMSLTEPSILCTQHNLAKIADKKLEVLDILIGLTISLVFLDLISSTHVQFHIGLLFSFIPFDWLVPHTAYNIFITVWSEWKIKIKVKWKNHAKLWFCCFVHMFFFIYISS